MILLDENKQVQELITHTEEEIDEDKILDVANEIIRNHQDKIYLGNLYYNKYSYAINDKTNLLIIVSNEEINHELTSNLIISIIIFILLELIILFVSKILTTWIIKPGVESFLKQKQFVADASHELKTPLSVIMTNLSVYEETKDEKWLNNIKEESERMNKLITNLLDLASLEEKKDIRKYQNINLSKLVERSILTFDGLFYENNIKVEYYLDEDIYFNCNPDEIKQMIGILLDNAIKHSSSKGNVIITLSKDKFKIILEVKNKGRAITKGMEDKIFERFYRDDEARNRNDNRYGLGLSIAKQIVINHNGEISVSSNNGYTTFKVKLNQK